MYLSVSRFLILTLGFVLLSSCGSTSKVRTSGQSDGPSSEELRKVRLLVGEGQTDKALSLYDELIAKYPSSNRLLEQKAGLLLEMKEFGDAEKTLFRIIEVSPQPDVRVYQSLGYLYFEQDRYSESAEYYKKYVDVCDPKESACRIAKQRLDNANFAKWAIENPVEFEPQKLAGGINSDYPDYLPAFSIDGSRIIFTRRINNQEDFFESNMIDGTFSEAVPIHDLNTPYNEGAHTLSADGKLLIFTVCNVKASFGSCDLFYSEWNNDKWSRPKNLDNGINSSAWDSQPSISADGKTLVFSSKRKGGKGGQDLWTSNKNIDGVWSDARPLAGTVNSAGDEETPYLHPDGLSLYFRSNGHPGMGDFDVFIARRNKIGDPWSEVTNLGYPINTKKSEGGLTVSRDGKTAYYTVENVKNGKSDLDLYSFPLPEKAKPSFVSYLSVTVVDKETQEPVAATLSLVKLDTEEEYISEALDNEGQGLFALPAGHSYMVQLTHPEYLYHSEHISTSKIHDSSDPFNYKIELLRVKPTTVTSTPTRVVLKNIFFETGSSELLPSSMSEIRALGELLEQSPEIKIKIVGYTDNVGQPSDNLILSKNRAKAVYQSLIDRGIATSRLQYDGRGEQEPIADNNTASGRQQNRRTEFEVIK